MSLFNELKRRNVLRVAIAYLAVSWLLVQIVETLFPVFDLSNASIRVVVIVLAIGFPLVLIFSWLYELTPEGLKKDKDVDHSSELAHHTGKKLDRVIIILLALSLGYLAFDKFVLDPARDVELVEQATEQARTQAFKESFGANSIAVLPFVNMSDDTSNEYFSDGISEELLNLLSRVPNLRVISRSSAFSFKGKDINIPAIAAQLDVAHVLEGSVRKAGNKVRITAQLIEARSDKHLWSETYDRELSDIFTIQDEISAAIVAALKFKLGLDVSTVPQAVVIANPDAYEAFLRGRFLFAQRTRDGIESAIGEFEKAIVMYPNYALAQAEMALSTLILTRFQDGDSSQSRATGEIRAEAIASAQPHVSRALALDPTLAEANAAAGWLAINRGEPDEVSLGYFQNAIKFNPNYSDAYNWLGAKYESSFPPRYSEAFLATEKAAQLDPLSQRALQNYARILIMRGQLAEADIVLEKLSVLSQHHYLSQRAFRNSIGGNWSAQILGVLDLRLLDSEGKGSSGTLRTYLAGIGLADEAMAVFDPPRIGTLWQLGKTQEALELARARLDEDPTSEDDAYTLLNAQVMTGIYSPEAIKDWEDDWQEGPRGWSPDDMAALIDMRRSVGEEDVSDLITGMKQHAQYEYDGGITAQGSPDYAMGLALFLQGDQEDGLDLIGKSVNVGKNLALNRGFLQSLYNHPGFTPILEVHLARQERERHKILTVVCKDSPYAEIWQPEVGTCEQFAAESSH